MNREEYLERLSWLLSDIPDEEREEAISYYRDYFEDAGAEQEAAVIADLDSPEKTAAVIKENLKGKNPEAGEYTETGYQDERYRENGKVPDLYAQPVVVKQKMQKEEKSKPVPQTYTEHKGIDHWILWVILLVLIGIPVGIPVLASLFSVLLSFVVLIFGIALGAGGAALGLLVGGASTLAVGIVRMFRVPAQGFVYSGIGCLLVGAGLICLWICTVLGKGVLPALWKGSIFLCKKPFRLFKRKLQKQKGGTR